jgi:cell division protease FtsH
VLTANRAILDQLAKELLEKETLDHNQLATIFAKVKKLPARLVWKSNPKRPVSTKGPIKVPARIALDADAKPTVKAKPPAKAKPATKAKATAAAKPAAKRTKPASK